MKVLLIGNGTHLNFINSVKFIRSEEDISFDVFSYKYINPESTVVYGHVYNARKRKDRYIKKLYKKKLKYEKKLIKKRFERIRNSYDIIHIHFLEKHTEFLMNNLLNSSSKLIISIWGSDFYKKSLDELNKYISLFNKASLITFTSKETLKEFKKNLNVNTPLVTQPFGLALIDYLHHNKYTKEKAKKILGLNNSFTITVGTNGRRMQNHIEIFEAINSVINYLPHKTKILLPLTYKREKEHLAAIKKYIKENKNIDFVLFEEFMYNHQLALLSSATDVLIQVQNTDQFSGTMLEHIYAGSKIITGSWLPYKILIEKGIPLNLVEKVEDVGKKIIEIKDQENFNLEHQQNVVWELSSWSSNANKWVTLYRNVINDNDIFLNK